MHRPEGSYAARYGEGMSVSPVGLYPPATLGVHGCVVGVRHDHFVTHLFYTPRHPLAFRPSLQKNLHRGIGPKELLQMLPISSYTALDHLACFRQDRHLAFPHA